MTTITLRGESSSQTFEIVEFSMIEPSTTHIRFRTSDGRPLEAHGMTLEYRGDIDKLPPFKP